MIRILIFGYLIYKVVSTDVSMESYCVDNELRNSVDNVMRCIKVGTTEVVGEEYLCSLAATKNPHMNCSFARLKLIQYSQTNCSTVVTNVTIWAFCVIRHGFDICRGQIHTRKCLEEHLELKECHNTAGKNVANFQKCINLKIQEQPSSYLSAKDAVPPILLLGFLIVPVAIYLTYKLGAKKRKKRSRRG